MIPLPLLHKELVEQSARRRTYALRVVHAGLLALLFLLICYDLGRGGNGLLGRGDDIFEALVYTLGVALMVLMPALTPGAIAHEREQGTLVLVQLTRIGPWSLLLQKLAARLLVAGGFIAIALPLLAIAYGYGGVSADLIGVAAFVLLLTAVQATAVTLAVSAWCGGTVGAFLGAYIALGLLYGGLPWLMGAYGGSGWDTCWHQVPLVLFDIAQRGQRMGLTGMTGMPFSTPQWLPGALTLSTGILLSTGLALLLARWGLTRRGGEARGNPLLRLFRALDRGFEAADRRLGRRRRGADVPIDRPVAWRECHRRTLANARYLVRLVLPLVALALFAAIGLRRTQSAWGQPELGLLLLGLVGFACLLLTVLGASVVAGERGSQTLDVLLTTPLAARAIVAEKAAALARVHLALAVPALVVLAVRWWSGSEAAATSATWPYSWSSRSEDPDPWSPLLGAFTILVVPKAATWLAIAAGLVLRTRVRAVATALAVLAAWLASALLVVLVMELLRIRWRSPFALLGAFTPGFVPALNECAARDLARLGSAPLLAMALFAATQVGLWLGLRAWCLGLADRLLRR